MHSHTHTQHTQHTPSYLALDFFLHKEKRNTVGGQRATQLDVAKLCVHLVEAKQLAMLTVDALVNALENEEGGMWEQSTQAHTNFLKKKWHGKRVRLH